MASGNSIFILRPQGSIGTATAAATPDVIVDTGTPVTYTPVLDFDTTTAEHRDWHVTVPSQYAGGGFTISWKGGTDNTNVGTFILAVRCINVADATIMTGDLGVDAATATTITDTPPTTPINKLNYSTTGTMTHSNAGSPAVGDYLVIRASRDISDTNTGDLQLAEILILET